MPTGPNHPRGSACSQFSVATTVVNPEACLHARHTLMPMLGATQIRQQERWLTQPRSDRVPASQEIARHRLNFHPIAAVYLPSDLISTTPQYAVCNASARSPGTLMAVSMCAQPTADANGVPR